MKSILCVLLIGLTSNLYACLGGQAQLANGQIFLTAERMSLEGGMIEASLNTIDALENDQMVGTSYTNKEGELKYVEVKVAYVEKDNGGIIYTVYEISNSEDEPYYIKVESNYMGNGIRAKGLKPYFDISETFGC